MKLLGFIFILLFSYVSGAGTSVGNFNYFTQKEFDFRVGYPKTWLADRKLPGTPADLEQWKFANADKVQDTALQSSATFLFIKAFPAKNEGELLKEIQRRHPALTWKKVMNPDFTIGFTSNQVFEGANKTRNFEYYFSEDDKVVRIEVIRNSFEQGASEIEVILSTVRRASGKPRVLSITGADSKKKSINVGEDFCYRIEMDVMKNDFKKESVAFFQIKGAPEHWSFKSVTWRAEEAAFLICLKVTERFGPDGLDVVALGLVSDNYAITNCTESTAGNIQCTSRDTMEPVKMQLPKVNNPDPDLQPPIFKAVSVGAKSNAVKITASDRSGLKIGKLVLAARSAIADDPDSQPIYDDQMTGETFEVEFKKERLSAGFTLLSAIELTDSVGNIAVLKAEKGEANYKYYVRGQKPVLTNIRVVNLLRSEK